MSYTFENTPFKWSKTGADPTESEIELGLQGGMALPAAYVNQQWTKTYLAINEIQQAIEDGDVGMPSDNVTISESLTVGTEHTILNTNNIVLGIKNNAAGYNVVVGKASKTPTTTGGNLNTGDIFVVGNGLTGGARSNAMRVTADGQVLGTTAYAASGADFAEIFEFQDGNPANEDRRGRFVTLDGEKIRLATADDDYIAGVISATPTVIGDAYTDDWHGKYKTDIFGARIMKDGAFQLADDFDEAQDEQYTSRLERPEWAAVGLVGKLVVVDDGSCKVNGYCYPSKDGIATASETGYRVMARIDDTHIRVLLK